MTRRTGIYLFNFNIVKSKLENEPLRIAKFHVQNCPDHSLSASRLALDCSDDRSALFTGDFSGLYIGKKEGAKIDISASNKGQTARSLIGCQAALSMRTAR